MTSPMNKPWVDVRSNRLNWATVLLILIKPSVRLSRTIRKKLRHKYLKTRSNRQKRTSGERNQRIFNGGYEGFIESSFSLQFLARPLRTMNSATVIFHYQTHSTESILSGSWPSAVLDSGISCAVWEPTQPNTQYCSPVVL